MALYRLPSTLLQKLQVEISSTASDKIWDLWYLYSATHLFVCLLFVVVVVLFCFCFFLFFFGGGGGGGGRGFTFVPASLVIIVFFCLGWLPGVYEQWCDHQGRQAALPSGRQWPVYWGGLALCWTECESESWWHSLWHAQQWSSHLVISHQLCLLCWQSML